jgi:hypothetical protein
MSLPYERPINHDPEAASLTAFERQRFDLIELQNEHALDLEASGTVDRARDVLRAQHQNIVDLYSKSGSDLTGDIPPPPNIGFDGDMTRIAAASTKRTRNGATIECPSLAFITTDLNGVNPHETYTFVAVAEIHKDGILTLDGFTPKDVRLVEGLLGELREAKAHTLHDLDDNMAAIREPDANDTSAPASKVRPIAF